MTDYTAGQVASARPVLHVLLSIFSRKSQMDRRIDEFNRLKALGFRNTPGAIVEGLDGSIEVLQAPLHSGDTWKLYGGHEATDAQVLRIARCRELAHGYV